MLHLITWEKMTAELWTEYSSFYPFRGKKDIHWFSRSSFIPLACRIKTQHSFRNQASLTLSSRGSWVADSASHGLFLPGSGLWTGPSMAKLEEPAIPSSFCLVQGGYGSNLCLSPGVLGGIMLKDVFSLPEVLTWQNISLRWWRPPHHYLEVAT